MTTLKLPTLLFVLSAGLAACRGGASSPSDVATSWADSLVDRPGPWRTVAVRLRGVANDIHLDEARPWPQAAWLHLSTAGENAVAQAAQADFYALGSDEIAVLHGVPAGFDPMYYPASAPRAYASRFAPEYRAVGTSAGGVRAYQRPPKELSDLRDGTTYLFILPNSTWVVGRGDGVGARLGAAVAGGREPPSLPMVSGSLVDATGCNVEGQSVFFASISWLHGSRATDADPIEDAGEVYYPGDQYARKFVYPSASAARASADDVTKLIASGASRNLNEAQALLRARTEGPTLFLDYGH